MPTSNQTFKNSPTARRRSGLPHSQHTPERAPGAMRRRLIPHPPPPPAPRPRPRPRPASSPQLTSTTHTHTRLAYPHPSYAPPKNRRHAPSLPAAGLTLSEKGKRRSAPRRRRQGLPRSPGAAPGGSGPGPSCRPP